MPDADVRFEGGLTNGKKVPEFANAKLGQPVYMVNFKTSKCYS